MLFLVSAGEKTSITRIFISNKGTRLSGWLLPTSPSNWMEGWILLARSVITLQVWVSSGDWLSSSIQSLLKAILPLWPAVAVRNHVHHVVFIVEVAPRHIHLDVVGLAELMELYVSVHGLESADRSTLTLNHHLSPERVDVAVKYLLNSKLEDFCNDPPPGPFILRDSA